MFSQCLWFLIFRMWYANSTVVSYLNNIFAKYKYKQKSCQIPVFLSHQWNLYTDTFFLQLMNSFRGTIITHRQFVVVQLNWITLFYAFSLYVYIHRTNFISQKYLLNFMAIENEWYFDFNKINGNQVGRNYRSLH